MGSEMCIRDRNKGDSTNPQVRCRYVAREIAFYRDDDFFAATPPLEGLKLMLSLVASDRRKRLMVIDARKAYLHAEVGREIFVELPPEIRRPGVCARLKRCLYGTRDAPARWEAHLAKQLQSMGFLRGRASPCCFYHPQRGLRCLVHGDDFVFAGTEENLDWVNARMADAFLVKVVGRLGPDSTDLQEMRILNRVARWTPGGVEFEADPRHAEILIRDFGKQGADVSIPGVRACTEGGRARFEEGSDDQLAEVKSLDQGDDAPLTPDQASVFRAGVARANYLALDRPDLSFAVKEL